MRKGLTLMELLVVISVLATLAALLFPVYLNVRNRMYAISCANQLRQIGLAIHMYAHDLGNDIPYNMPYGIDRLYPHYISDKSLFFCPRVKAIIPYDKLTPYSTSYFMMAPKALDNIARREPGEIGFSEVFAKRGDQTPIIYCEAHRYMPIEVIGACKDAMGSEKACWDAFLSPGGPIIVLRWGGKVDLIYKGGYLVSTVAVLVDY